MGSVPGGKTLQDGIASVSPWLTVVQIDNQTNQSVLVFLARNPEEPHPEDAIEHVIPANNTYGLPSGWLREPRATLLIRTGVDEAKLLRVPNNSKLQIRLAPHGLKVESTDAGIEVEPFFPPEVVPGHDTVPMVFRGESFNVAEGSRPSVAQQAMSQEPAQEPLSPSGPAVAAADFEEPTSPVIAPPPVDKEPTSPASAAPVAAPAAAPVDATAEEPPAGSRATAETAAEQPPSSQEPNVV